MHQRVRQLARAGKQQQTFGVQVQTADRLPLAVLQLGQLAEYGGAVLRIVVRHHFAHRLVIGNHACGRWIDTEADGLSVDLDDVAKLNALTDVSRFVVDRDTAFQNQLLHLQTRAHAGLGQHLVQLGRIDLRSQHTLGGHGAAVFLFVVEVTRDHIGKVDVLTFGRLEVFLGCSALCVCAVSYQICGIFGQLFSTERIRCLQLFGTSCLLSALAGQLGFGSLGLLHTLLAHSARLAGDRRILGLDHAGLASLLDRLGFWRSGGRLWHRVRCLVVHSGFPSGMTPSSSSTVRSWAGTSSSTASELFLSCTASSSSTP